MNRIKTAAFFCLIVLAGSSWAVTASANYSTPSQGIGGGGGNASSASYQNNGSAGIVVAGKMTSSSYTSTGGNLNSGVITSVAVVPAASGPLAATATLVYPNPFNPTAGNARVAYTLSSAADISIMIFNAAGRLVLKKEFVSGASGAAAGYNEYLWDGKGSDGEVVGNDVYFLRIVSGGKVIGKTKMAVLK